MRRETHCSGVLNDILHVTLAVRLISRVGTVGSKLRVLSDLKRETSTVGNVPMEGVDLDPTHRVECPKQILNWKARCSRYFDVHREEHSTHKFREVSRANPRKGCTLLAHAFLKSTIHVQKQEHPLSAIIIPQLAKRRQTAVEPQSRIGGERRSTSVGRDGQDVFFATYAEGFDRFGGMLLTVAPEVRVSSSEVSV